MIHRKKSEVMNLQPWPIGETEERGEANANLEERKN